MKKEIIIVIVLGIIMIVLAGLLFWPTKQLTNNNPPQNTEGIQITLPVLNQEIYSPLKITGSVNGQGWNGFEGQVGTVQLLDYKGNKLAQGILTATTDWMVLPTNFETTLNFAVNNPGPATLVFKNENPSGDQVREKTFTLPVKICLMPVT